MPDAENRTKARHLREMMDRSGIPRLQSKLRKISGLNASTISNIYQLKQEPNDLTFQALMQALSKVAEAEGIMLDFNEHVLQNLRLVFGSGYRSTGRPYVVSDADASRQDPRAIGHTIPLHTKVSAGPNTDFQKGIYADQFLPSALIPHPEWGLGAFMVDGDSMSPYFHEGDILFIGERLQRVQTGDILIVGFTSGEHTVKKLRVIDEKTWELVPLNPNHEIRRYTKEDISWYVPVLARFEPIWTRRKPKWDA